MTTLAAAVAVGDQQLLIDAPMAGPFPGWVKIDSELLEVGGQEYRNGTVLPLSSPADTAHDSGATVNYAGKPYNAAWLSATAGEGGGLPSQWTETPAGQVQATADDPDEAVLTVKAAAGSEGTGDLVFEVQGETGETLLSFDPYGGLNLRGASIDPSNGGATLRVSSASAPGAFVVDFTGDDGSGNMKVGFFATSGVVQPNIPASPTEQDIADVLVALGLASQVAVVLTGTAVAGGVTESQILAGGETIIITLTGATFKASFTVDDKRAILDGIVAAESEPAGWNSRVLSTAAAVRTNDTTVTVTIPSDTYSITADENITVTVPASVLVGTRVSKVATPTIVVTANA